MFHSHAQRRQEKVGGFSNIILAPPMHHVPAKGSAQARADEVSVPPFEQVPEQQAGPPTYVTPFPPTHVGIPSSVFDGGAGYQKREWHRRRWEHQYQQERMIDTNPWITGQHRVWTAHAPTNFIGDLRGQNNPKLKWSRKHVMGQVN